MADFKFPVKLDPLLATAVRRAEKERPGALKLAAESFGLGPSGAPTAHPTVMSELPIGMMVLASNLSKSALERFASEDIIPVLIDTSEARELVEKISKWDVEVQQVSSTIAAANVPRTSLLQLAAEPSVRYVEASIRLEPKCDFAHRSSGLVVGTTRTVGQTGKGVLVGIVDTGVDTDHPAFKKNGKTRIVNYLDQESGREYDSESIDRGDASESQDEVGHGTHVAGIAAGNGGGSQSELYAGVATEADIAVVKTTFDSKDIGPAVAHIFKIAESRSQPCVVNLSLGGHSGGHDGTTITERSIDQLSGKGRVVVAAAGNEGDSTIHAGTVLPRDQSEPARWVADFSIEKRVIQGVPAGLVYFQVWTLREDDLSVRLRSPNGDLFETPHGEETTFDRTNVYVEAFHRVAEPSRDNMHSFLVVTRPLPQWLKGWSVIVEEKRSGDNTGVRVGSVHCWIIDEEMGGFTSGFTHSHIVGMPGTSFSAITVASWATRKGWLSRDPNQPTVSLPAINVEDISYFSSAGPTRDGQTKPEIAAPGQWLVSALSAAADESEMPLWLRLPNIEYAALQGTSMAAPYVTGSVALLLEKEPDLDWAEVKRRLILSAQQDLFTTPCWNPRWGYGKIDVERLLEIQP